VKLKHRSVPTGNICKLDSTISLWRASCEETPMYNPFRQKNLGRQELMQKYC